MQKSTRLVVGMLLLILGLFLFGCVMDWVFDAIFSNLDTALESILSPKPVWV